MRIRITPVIATLVRQSATKNRRSLPGEVNFQLERAYEPQSSIFSLLKQTSEEKKMGFFQIKVSNRSKKK